MEYLNVLIGNKEMYIPVNDKLGKTMLYAGLFCPYSVIGMSVKLRQGMCLTGSVL